MIGEEKTKHMDKTNSETQAAASWCVVCDLELTSGATICPECVDFLIKEYQDYRQQHGFNAETLIAEEVRDDI